MQSAGVWRHFSSYRDDVLPASSAPVLVLFLWQPGQYSRGSQGSSQLIITIGGLLQLRRYAGCVYLSCTHGYRTTGSHTRPVVQSQVWSDL